MFPKLLLVGEVLGNGSKSIVYECRYRYSEKNTFIKGALKAMIAVEEYDYVGKPLETRTLENVFNVRSGDEKTGSWLNSILESNFNSVATVKMENILNEVHISNQIQSLGVSLPMKYCPIYSMCSISLERKKGFETPTPNRIRNFQIDEDIENSPSRSLYNRNESSEGEDDSDLEVILLPKENESTNGNIPPRKDHPAWMSPVHEDDQPAVTFFYHSTDQLSSSSSEESSFSDSSSETTSEKTENDHLNESVVEGLQVAREKDDEEEEVETTMSEEGYETPEDQKTSPVTPEEFASSTKSLLYATPTSFIEELLPITPGRGIILPKRIKLVLFLMPLMDGSLKQLVEEEEGIIEFEKTNSGRSQCWGRRKINKNDKIRFWYEYLSTQSMIRDDNFQLEPSLSNFCYRWIEERKMYEFYFSDLGITSEIMDDKMSITKVEIFSSSLNTLARKMCFELSQRRLVDPEIEGEGEEDFEEKEEDLDPYYGRMIPELGCVFEHIEDLEKVLWETDYKEELKHHFKIWHEDLKYALYFEKQNLKLENDQRPTKTANELSILSMMKEDAGQEGILKFFLLEEEGVRMLLREKDQKENNDLRKEVKSLKEKLEKMMIFYKESLENSKEKKV